VLERGDLRPHFGEALAPHFAGDDAFAFRQHGDDLAPGIDDQAVPEGAPTVLVPPALGRGRDVALVLDRPGTQQHFPVRKAGRMGEGRGHAEQVAGRLHQRPVELGKAQVVADAQADAKARRVERDRLAAGLQGAAFVVLLTPVVVAKEMDLVVARNLLTRRREDEVGVHRPAFLAALQGQGAGHEPEPVLARRFGEHRLDRSFAGCFGDRELVAIASAHDAEILGKDRQLGALAGGARHERAGGVEVALDARRRNHLQGGDLHRAPRSSVWSSSSAARRRRPHRRPRPPAGHRTRCARPARPSDRPTAR
jgi:hypothetical protein